MALYTAFGVATGSGLFALAGMAGLILLISTLPHFAVLSRYVGGLYLTWMGINMLRVALTSRRNHAPENPESVGLLSPLRAYRNGLLTNLTNPKAWAFYLSLFVLVVSPSTSVWGKVFLTVAMFLISFFWYATVVILITNNQIRPAFMRGQLFIQSGVACLLIWLGGSLFFQS